MASHTASAYTPLPEIIANTSRGWNSDPAGIALGTERTGISAALWSNDTGEPREVAAEADPTRHILCCMLAPFTGETLVDGASRFRGTYKPGMVNLIHAGRKPRALLEGRFRILHVYVPDGLLSGLLNEEGTARDAIELLDPACAYDQRLHALGFEVLAEMHQGQPMSSLRIDALGQDLAIQLLRRWSSLNHAPGSMRARQKGGLASWQERRTIEYLAHNLAEDFTLETLAVLTGLSVFHFARIFKQTTGLPPHAYLRNLRCEKAKELLVGSAQPVTEIAAQVGYDTPQAFARMFRAEVGVSPSEYRRERRS